MQREALSGWAEVFLFFAGGLLFVGITLLVSRMLRPHRPNPEKLTPYESGEQPIGSPWIQFNIRFYLVAIVFLLFEVELVFLFPWATIFANRGLVEQTDGVWAWMSLVEVIIFIVILALGLAYAWGKGHLDWAKPSPQTRDYPSPVPPKLYEQINERYKSK
jgi:NADH-quinone oxidoreductase subunit A